MTADLSKWLDRVTCGDALEKLRTLPDCSVHCCVTSPPYWGLRDYGCEGQMGLEPTPEAYIARMAGVFGEVRRVLRDDGTLWLNIGDSYSSGRREGHGTRVGYKQQSNRGMNGTADPARPPQPPGLKPKDLCMIPARLALALQQDGWYLRSDIVWSKPNPMPESVRDRPTKAHEYVFLLAKSQRYYFDADAVREPHKQEYKFSTYAERIADGGSKAGGGSAEALAVGHNKIHGRSTSHTLGNPSGRNIRDVWTIPTSPCPEAHFAVMPPRLVEPCIKAGTSERGCCPECGAPWERVVERGDSGWEERKANGATGGTLDKGHNTTHGEGCSHDLGIRHRQTIGWQPTCTCDAGEPVPCTALDPFFGAGTVGLVAQGLGRRFVGIELNPEYVAIAERRIAAARRAHQPALDLQEATAE